MELHQLLPNIEFLKKLRLVTVDCPYAVWEDPRVKNLFYETIRFKIRGYQAYYPYGVLPFDTTDFIARHHLICLESKSQLKPIGGYKVVSERRCNQHNMSIPILGALKLMGCNNYYTALKSLFDKALENNGDIKYSAGFTVDPEFHQHKEIPAIVWAVNTFDLQSNQNQYVFAAAATKVKADIMFRNLGYKDLCFENTRLAPLNLPAYAGAEVALVSTKPPFSEYAQTYSQPYLSMWQNRIEIQKLDELKKLVA